MSQRLSRRRCWHSAGVVRPAEDPQSPLTGVRGPCQNRQARHRSVQRCPAPDGGRSVAASPSRTGLPTIADIRAPALGRFAPCAVAIGQRTAFHGPAAGAAWLASPADRRTAWARWRHWSGGIVVAQVAPVELSGQGLSRWPRCGVGARQWRRWHRAGPRHRPGHRSASGRRIPSAA